MLGYWFTPFGMLDSGGLEPELKKLLLWDEQPLHTFYFKLLQFSGRTATTLFFFGQIGERKNRRVVETQFEAGVIRPSLPTDFLVGEKIGHAVS
jgi:hypothetical protein